MVFNTDLYEIFIPPYLLIGISCLVTFLITFSAIPSIVRIANNKGLMAHPNGRTSHMIPTPNLGGIAIFAGVIISSILFTGINTAHELKFIIAGMLILFFVGLKDDLQDLPPYQKLIGQLISALIIILPGDFYLHTLHGLFGIHELPFIPAILLTIFLFLALINSLNLIDGIDGLASGIGILASFFFGVVFLMDGQMAYAIMSFIVATSLLAFFYYNVFGKKNKIFMGDTGSMLIGLLLAILTINFLNLENSGMFVNQTHYEPAVCLSVLIIPLFDTARVMVIRMSRGKSPFAADRIHIHHHVLRLTGNHLTATVLILSLNLVFIALPFLFRNLHGEVLTLIILGLATILFNIPIYLNRQSQGFALKFGFE
jgi:UDP-GlcNAc:undecaprenyl-phosphate/decaprenyl-phosphate GlcNAc-1-phosphate transferase